MPTLCRPLKASFSIHMIELSKLFCQGSSDQLVSATGKLCRILSDYSLYGLNSASFKKLASQLALVSVLSRLTHGSMCCHKYASLYKYRIAN